MLDSSQVSPNGPLEGDGVTRLLDLWRQGDRSALARLTEAIYPHLRKIAANRLKGLPPEATISPTELLHETWIRLAQSKDLHFEHRASFYGAAAVMMRNILVDRARSRNAMKRNGGNISSASALPVELTALASSNPFELDLEEIDRALHALEQVCERQARQVDLRFFVGLTASETADVLGVSEATLKRDWLAARMFIKDFVGIAR
jgi:RNA polymerase sigma factor (TIGR02999 family)